MWVVGMFQSLNMDQQLTCYSSAMDWKPMFKATVDFQEGAKLCHWMSTAHVLPIVVLHSTVQHSTTQHNTAQHSIVYYSTALHCTALLFTIFIVRLQSGVLFHTPSVQDEFNI